jgi:hypothetical protein
MNENLKIEIFTAKFIKFETTEEITIIPPVGKKKAIVDVMAEQNVILRRAYDAIMVEHIKNPDKLIIGILTKPGTLLNTIINGNRYYRLFEKVGWCSEEELINIYRKRKLKKILK